MYSIRNVFYVFSTLIFFSYVQSQTVASDLQIAQYFNSGSTPTWNHTTTTAANRIILVSANTAPKTGSVASDVTGVTYGGTAMSFLAKAEYQSGLKSYLYYLLNPASGVNSITVTKSNTNDNCAVASASFSNVNQVIPPTNTFGGNTTSASATIATLYQNDLLLGFCGTANNVTGLGAGQTQLCEAGSASKVYVNLSSKTATGTSTTFSISIASSSADWELILLPLAPLNSTFLPIELTKFDAQCLNNTVEISWCTASEKNNQFFSVERSRDGINYETIAHVQGQGNTQVATNYHYIDTPEDRGGYYYRISQTDFDGQTVSYPPVYTDCKMKKEISIFPNPTSGNIFLNTNEKYSKVLIKDITGKQILDFYYDTEGTKEIGMRQLPEGVYFLSISNLDGNTDNFKIIKQ